MELTWGFLVLMMFFVLPGFIIRRLYFHSDFSKLYRYNENLLKTIFYALIPGIINVIVVFILFDKLFQEIDLGKVIDVYKIISDPEKSFSTTEIIKIDNTKTTIKQAFISAVLPFLCFLVTSAFVIGFLSGRLVRIFGLDIRWQILRFKNPWFYLFFGHQAKFKNFGFLKQKNKDESKKEEYSKFLFTNVDALVETSEGDRLYSGVLVDYELRAENNQELSKLILRNAQRYTKDANSKTTAKSIPGNLFILDCTKLINLNLFYVYGESTKFLDSKAPWRIYLAFALISVLLIPFMFFQISWITWPWYIAYFNLSIVGKIFFGSWGIQLFQILNPFTILREEGKIKWEGSGYWMKILALPIAFLVSLGVEYISQWVLSLF
jgi:hypothetical protein